MSNTITGTQYILPTFSTTTTGAYTIPTGTTSGSTFTLTGTAAGGIWTGAFQPYTFERTASIPEAVTSETEAVILDVFRAFANMGIIKDWTHWVAYHSNAATGHAHTFLNNATKGMATGGATTSNLVLGGHNHDHTYAAYTRGHSTTINYTMNKLYWVERD